MVSATLKLARSITTSRSSSVPSRRNHTLGVWICAMSPIPIHRGPRHHPFVPSLTDMLYIRVPSGHFSLVPQFPLQFRSPPLPVAVLQRLGLGLQPRLPGHTPGLGRGARAALPTNEKKCNQKSRDRRSGEPLVQFKAFFFNGIMSKKKAWVGKR